MSVLPKCFRILRRSVLIAGATFTTYYHVYKNIFPSFYIPEVANLSINNASEKHYRILREVCADLNIEPKGIKLCYSHDLTGAFSVGNSYIGRHVPASFDQPALVLALPRCFSLNSRKEMEEEGVFSDKTVDWTSPNGKRIEVALNMKEESLKFVIAQELLYSQNRHLYGLHSGFFTLTGYSVVLGISGWSSLFLICLGGVLSITTFLAYLVSLRVVSKYLDFKVDEQAAMLGKDYCLGGLLYYVHSVMYNLVKRDVVNDGYSVYDVNGDVRMDEDHPKFEERIEKLLLMKKWYEDKSKREKDFASILDSLGSDDLVDIDSTMESSFDSTS